MSNRLPPIVRDEVGPGAQPVYDRFAKLADDMFGDPQNAPFILKRSSDGALVGPFPFFFEQHEAGEHVLGVVGKLAMIPNFPPDAKEVVILAVGAHFKAAYELYAHTNVATKKVGMSKDVVDKIARGEKPDGLSEQNSIAYDTAHYLVSTPGPLPQELWDKCMDVFGKEATIGLIHYVGSYAHTCIILNAMDAAVPE